jgi:hypothetical protein
MEGKGSGRKRKRKQSLLKNAKKYGKKGKCGRGSHLNEDIYQYFVRVLELLHTNDFQTEEEKGRLCVYQNINKEFDDIVIVYFYSLLYVLPICKISVNISIKFRVLCQINVGTVIIRERKKKM